jgi:hypothetical protein
MVLVKGIGEICGNLCREGVRWRRTSLAFLKGGRYALRVKSP